MPQIKPTKVIRRTDLPQFKHVQLLDAYEKLAIQSFDLIHKRLIKDIEKLLASSVMEKSLKSEFEKLAKSDEEAPRLMRRWTGKIPKINLSMSEKVESIIRQYLLAMRYLMLGPAAGREAMAAAKVQFGDRVMPGIVFGTYLHAIDTERKYYEMLYKKDAPKIPMTLIKGSFDIIRRQTERMLDQSLDDYKHRILDVVDVSLAQHRFDNLFAVGDKAHDVKDSMNKPETINHAVDKALVTIDKKSVSSQLQGLAVKAKEGFERSVKTNLGTVTAVGAHQAMIEVYGAESGRIKAALVNIRDGKCCDHCEKFSRHPDGSFRLYELNEFSPAGANNYKTRAQWTLSIPPLHPNCRCHIVHIPNGFKIDTYGSISKIKESV